MNDSIEDRISKQRKFDEYLIEAIDEVLTLLGAAVKNTIFLNLENNFNIPKNEIPNHLNEFTHYLQQTFDVGAARLEIEFMRHLHSKINVNFQVNKNEWIVPNTEELTFEDYVCNARNSYCNL
ncbi:MAG: hypothetical protein ABSF44_04565 [Candidatus Bathyarchaeia archaeon]|jgi:hypothetical protein